MTGQPLGAVAILGLPGAGKTTLARGLAQRCGARVVSRDEIRLAMFGACSATDGEKGAAFAAVISAVTTNCALGHLSIVEGMPFSRYGEYEAVAAAVAAQGQVALPVFLSIDPAVASQRIAAQRGSAHAIPHDRDADLPYAVARRFRELPPSTLLLDARREAEELVAAAAERIAATRTAG